MRRRSNSLTTVLSNLSSFYAIFSPLLDSPRSPCDHRHIHTVIQIQHIQLYRYSCIALQFAFNQDSRHMKLSTTRYFSIFPSIHHSSTATTSIPAFYTKSQSRSPWTLTRLIISLSLSFPHNIITTPPSILYLLLHSAFRVLLHQVVHREIKESAQQWRN